MKRAASLLSVLLSAACLLAQTVSLPGPGPTVHGGGVSDGDITAVRISGEMARNVTDGAITASSTTLTSATANFTSADVGREIRITGAGAAGAVLTSRISSVSDSSTAVLASAASTTVSGARTNIGVDYNGWTAEIDIQGLAAGGTYAMGLGTNNDPTAAKLVFQVTRPGYSTSAVLGTVVDSDYGTSPIHRPYPNQANNAEWASGGKVTLHVALSDFVYAGDTVTVSAASGFYTASGTPNNTATSLAVTNNSSLAYSATKSIGRWLGPVQYDRVTGSSFTVEAGIFNRFARNGKPLAAVVFTCADEHSHSVSSTATAMTTSTLATQMNDRNTVLVYAASMDASTLTQGDAVTCNFAAYPWAGDATAVLNSDLVANGGSGYAQPDSRLGPLTLLLDKTGAYGGGFAVVDPTNGHASGASTWVASTQAAAESAYGSSTANSYTTVDFAAAAIKAWNNANLGRNEPGGGTILLTSATNSLGVGNSSLGTMKTWLTVTRLSTVTRANAAITSGGNGSGTGAQKLRLYDVSINDGGTNYMFWDNGVLWFDRCGLNLTASNGDIIAYSALYATGNDIAGSGPSLGGIQTATLRELLVRGNSAGLGIWAPAGAEAFVGNANLSPMFQAISGTKTDNAVIGFNSQYAWQGHGFWLEGYASSGTLGFAAVNNLVEGVNDGGMFVLGGQDANTFPINNILLWHNSTIGERGNFAYNWIAPGTNTAQFMSNWSVRGNIFDGYNSKSDTESNNGDANGNWPFVYGVGVASNQKRYTVSGIQDDKFVGLWTFYGGSFNFVNCAAYNYSTNGCSNAGSGDYHLTSSATTRNLVGAGLAVLPYDLSGTARRNDGTGAAGVYEY